MTTLIRKVMMEKVQLSETEISALAIFILSHGEDNGTIFAADYPFRVDHDILFPLAADKCPGLAGKPKLIFVQVCEQVSWSNFAKLISQLLLTLVKFIN